MAFQPLSKDPNQTLGNAVGRTARNVFNRTLGRLFGAGLGRGAESVLGNQRATARWSNRNGQTDWRVKLTIPSESVQLQNARLQSLNDQPHGLLAYPNKLFL